MKFSTSILLLLPALASAFAPAASVSRSASAMSAAPKTFEEDLEATRKVIAGFIDGDDGAAGAEEEPAAEEEE